MNNRVGSSRLFRRLTFAVSANAVGPALALLSAPILARALGVADRGNLAIATVPLLLMTGALTLGMPEALAVYVARSQVVAREMLLRATVVLAATAMVAGASLYAASDMLSHGMPQVASLVRGSAVALPILLLQWIPRGLAHGLNRWDLLNSEKIAVAILRAGVLAALFVNESLTLVSAAQTLIWVPCVGWLFYGRLLMSITFRRSQVEPAATYQDRRFLRFGLSVWTGSIAGILLTRLDQLLIPAAGNAADLGNYTVAVNVADLGTIIVGAFAAVSLTSGAGPGRLNELYTASSWGTLLLGIAMLLLIATAPWLLPFVFGADFHGAVLPAQILALAMIPSMAGSVAGAALTASGYPGVRSSGLALAVLVNLGLVLVLVPNHGAVGAAVATLIAMWVANSWNLIFSRKRIGAEMINFFWPAR